MTKKKDFINLYNKLYKDNFEVLEKLRKEEKKRVSIILKAIAIIFISVGLVAILQITGFAGVFSSGSMFSMLFTMGVGLIGGIGIIIIMIICIGSIIKQSKKSSVVKKSGKVFEGKLEGNGSYKEVFKEKIMTPIIHETISNSEYLFKDGLSESEYNKANWESFDIFDSEDKIIIPLSLENATQAILTMSEIHTQDRRKDSDGSVTYVTLFQGLAGYVELPKDINCYLKVRNNNFLFKTKNNVEMDVTEFEKVFDVDTNDKIKAMQILTSDIMMDFLEFTKQNKFKFEFYINNSMMYIRFHTGDLFEPEVFKLSMEYEYLEKYVNVLNSVKEITEHICNTVLNTDL